LPVDDVGLHRSRREGIGAEAGPEAVGDVEQDAVAREARRQRLVEVGHVGVATDGDRGVQLGVEGVFRHVGDAHVDLILGLELGHERVEGLLLTERVGLVRPELERVGLRRSASTAGRASRQGQRHSGGHDEGAASCR
jgi:hypothetical protein